MDIIARKRSEDPVQEHLREHKAEWNEGISAFIKALIALKKALNGKEVSEMGLPKGNIKDPLPDQIPTLLDRLSSEFARLTQDGDSIINEQEHYSQTRKHHQERPVGEQPQSTVANRKEELIKIARFYELIKLAGKKEDLIKKHPHLSKEIEEISSQILPKYLDWSVKQLVNKHSVLDIIPTVNAFNQRVGTLKIKDINQYKDLKDLENLIKGVELKPSKTQEKKLLKSDAKTIYEDDNVVIVRPDSKDACISYGKNTKWCITMKSQPFYEQYAGSGVVFYFILRKKPLGDSFDKIAYVYQLEGVDNKQYKLTDIFDAMDQRTTNDMVIHFAGDFKGIIEADLPNAPEPLIKKIRNGTATDEEFLGYWNAMKADKYSLYSIFNIINNKYNPLIQNDLVQMLNDDTFNKISIIKKLSIEYIIQNVDKLLNETSGTRAYTVLKLPEEYIVQNVDKLLNDKDSRVRYETVRKLPQEYIIQNIDKLLNDESGNVHYATLQKLPEKYIIQNAYKLLNDKDVNVRIDVAYRLPIEYIIQNIDELLNDKDSRVRFEVVIRLPQEYIIQNIDKLLNDESGNVRFEVVRKLPQEYIIQNADRLLNDKNSDVSDYILRKVKQEYIIQNADRLLNDKNSDVSDYILRKVKKASRKEGLVKLALVKESSNIFSRLWTYVATPFRFGDEDRWVRKNLLQAALELQGSLADIGKYIVSTEEDAIPQTVYNTRILIQTFLNDLAQPLLDLNKYKAEKGGHEKEEGPIEPVSTPKVERDKTKNKEESDESVSEAEPVKTKKEKAREQIIPKSDNEAIQYTEEQSTKILEFEDNVTRDVGPNLELIRGSITADKDKIDRSSLAPISAEIIALQRLLPEFFTAVDTREPFNVIYDKYLEIKNRYGIVKEVAAKLKLMFLADDGQLHKFAQARFTRWLGRKRLELLKGQNYRLKIQADRSITDAYKALDKLMNLLQKKNAPMEPLIRSLTELSFIFGELSSAVTKLANIHNDYIKLDRLKSKSQGKTSKQSPIDRVDIKNLEKMQNALRPEEEEDKDEEEEKKKPEIKPATKPTAKPTAAPKAKIPGFGDVRGVQGGISIPKSKFIQLINGGIISVEQAGIMTVNKKRMPTFRGFESFLQPGKTYKFEEKDGRIIILE